MLTGMTRNEIKAIGLNNIAIVETELSKACVRYIGSDEYMFEGESVTRKWFVWFSQDDGYLCQEITNMMKDANYEGYKNGVKVA